MQSDLKISVDWERLDEGRPEERACFAAIGIRCNNHWLTEGRDGFVKRVRSEPLLSGYHLAEWLAWNWWRLRWEPRSAVADWNMAHRMPTIGQGYVWPNVTIRSDGEITALVAKATPEREATAFRYISEYTGVVSSRVFELEIDRFINQILGQLQAEKISATNLHEIWSALSSDRSDPIMASWRKLEALLGNDPGDGDEQIIQGMLNDAQQLGDRAVQELAADHAQGGHLYRAEDLRKVAASDGYSVAFNDAVSFPEALRLSSSKDVPAWRLGVEAANALRAQQSLGSEPIDDLTLADLTGTDKRALSDDRVGNDISFSYRNSANHGKTVLRSRWKSGRRFELARLLGDRVVPAAMGNLQVATRAYTYRQKMQRSFAAELLSPFDAVEDLLDGDYSSESQQDAAEKFGVSELTIRTLLLNRRRIEREELDEDSIAV